MRSPFPLPTPHPILSQDFRAYRISVHGFPCFSGKGASALFLFGKGNGKAGRERERERKKERKPSPESSGEGLYLS